MAVLADGGCSADESPDHERRLNVTAVKIFVLVLVVVVPTAAVLTLFGAMGLLMAVPATVMTATVVAVVYSAIKKR